MTETDRLSVREHFAAHALQGILAARAAGSGPMLHRAPPAAPPTPEATAQSHAEYAVMCADALIAQLNKGG